MLFKEAFQLKSSWIFLPGFVAVLLVYAVRDADRYVWVTTKAFNESFAPWLVLLIFIMFLAKALVCRDALIVYLAALALVFLVRELNDTVFKIFGTAYLFKSKKLVDVLLAGMALWGLCWHERLFACLHRSGNLKILLFGSMWTYFFSQLIARRVFRDILPLERLLHVQMEETAETAAHLFFLCCALFSLFFYAARTADRVSAGRNVSPLSGIVTQRTNVTD
jgi:hypothetical protein